MKCTVYLHPSYCLFASEKCIPFIYRLHMRGEYNLAAVGGGGRRPLVPSPAAAGRQEEGAGVIVASGFLKTSR